MEAGQPWSKTSGEKDRGIREGCPNLVSLAGIFGRYDTKTVVLKSIMQKSHLVARARQRDVELTLIS
jgi:hypothetical protein